jgi:hypothetical protein
VIFKHPSLLFVIDWQSFYENLIELVLDTGHGQVFLVFRLVYRVEWATAIENVRTLGILPDIRGVRKLAKVDQVVQRVVVQQG